MGVNGLVWSVEMQYFLRRSWWKYSSETGHTSPYTSPNFSVTNLLPVRDYFGNNSTVLPVLCDHMTSRIVMAVYRHTFNLKRGLWCHFTTLLTERHIYVHLNEFFRYSFWNSCGNNSKDVRCGNIIYSFFLIIIWSKSVHYSLKNGNIKFESTTKTKWPKSCD